MPKHAGNNRDDVALFNSGIGNRMRAIREEKGLISTDLAQMVGMSQAQISRLENGKQGFRSATLHKIADALKVKAVFLINGEQKASPASMVRDVSFYGPGMPKEVVEALSSAKYEAFLMKSVKIYMTDEATFSRLSSMVRKAKVRYYPRGLSKTWRLASKT